MKKLFLYVVVLLVCNPVTYGSGLFEKISEMLPADWRAHEQPERIFIEKETDILALVIVPSMSGFESPRPTTFWFELRPAEYITPSNYKKAKERNKELRAKGHAYLRENDIRSIPHEIDKAPPWEFKYLPRNEEEDKKVKKYKSYYSSIVRLPDYYHEGTAYYYKTLNYRFEFEADENECEEVKDAVLGIMKKYDSRE
ncbi:MAG: hypothetical protein ACPGSB_00045 [Opitutales bacterium]